MTEAQAERAKALADAEAALKREAGARAAREAAQFEAAELARREAAQARRVAQRTAVLAGVAGFSPVFFRPAEGRAGTVRGHPPRSRTPGDQGPGWAVFFPTAQPI